MGLLEVIQTYDQEREDYIAELESEVKKLRAERAEALDLAVRGVQIHEASMLKLIASGALDVPEGARRS
jgi:hypothetical protein